MLKTPRQRDQNKPPFAENSAAFQHRPAWIHSSLRHRAETPENDSLLARVRVRAYQSVSVFFLHLFTLVSQVVDS